jgi:hypothetical protein
MKHIKTFESFLYKARVIETCEIIGDDSDVIEDAVAFLQRGRGKTDLNKECKGKPDYTFFHHNNIGTLGKDGLMHSLLDIHQIESSPKMTVEEYLNCINKVLNDNGYDSSNVKVQMQPEK